MRKKLPKGLTLDQLKEAGKQATEMAIHKGLISRDSRIDAIEKDPQSPKLPGIPAYLPHQWTIEAAKRIMFGLLREWQFKNKKNDALQENVAMFITFTVKRMREEEERINKELRKTPELIDKIDKKNKNIPTLHEVFTPLRKKESIKGIHHFFVDAFAVNIMVKRNDSTTDFVEWFFPWCDQLYQLWVRKDQKNAAKHDTRTSL